MSSSQHIINPRTQRPVKIGSRTWRKLVSDGIVEGKNEPDERELYSVNEGDNVEEKIEELNASLPPTQQAVRGRGRFAGKVVKRRRQPSTEVVAGHTIKTTAQKLRDRQVYESLHENNNFEEDLEAMIMRELSNTLSVTPPAEYKVNEPLAEDSESESDVYSDNAECDDVVYIDDVWE